MSADTSPVVVLVGPPGAGKTTVGEVLAARLGVAFVDTDQVVERETGRTIADIFIEDGEEAFRALEVAAVGAALEGEGVVALGGGAVLSEETRARLAGHRVVYLEVGVDDASRRTGLNAARPLLRLGNPRATWVKLLAARRPLYEEVATVVVATDGRAPEDVAAEIETRLAGSGDE